jgi:hypothetical protein
MPDLKSFMVTLALSAASFIVFGVIMSLVRRRMRVEPVEAIASAIDAALPRMPVATATGGAA